MYTPETLLLSLGIRTSYKGYAFLVTVLEQALEDESRLLSYTTRIFPFVADKCKMRGTQPPHRHQSMLEFPCPQKTEGSLPLSTGRTAQRRRIY